MSDENKPLEDTTAEAPIENWSDAFASLEPETKDSLSTDDTTPDPGTSAPTQDIDGSSEDSTGTVPDVALGTGDTGGGPHTEPGTYNETGDEADWTFSEEELGQRLGSIKETIEDQAMREVANLFVEKNIRNQNGKLGATINDADIYRKDDQGIPTFYNPDTGKPFTGDNPRSQARQWVKEYNDELKETFNSVVVDRMGQLQEEAKPMLELLEFTPKFEKLDPVRQQMMDAIIEDYEIHDKGGNTIGYSCNLNNVLTQVNKQIRSIQAGNWSGAGQAAQAAANVAAGKSSPALDMKAGAGANKTKPEFKSMAEAMEWEQDQLLEKLKSKGK